MPLVGNSLPYRFNAFPNVKEPLLIVKFCKLLFAGSKLIVPAEPPITSEEVVEPFKLPEPVTAPLIVKVCPFKSNVEPEPVNVIPATVKSASIAG